MAGDALAELDYEPDGDYEPDEAEARKAKLLAIFRERDPAKKRALLSGLDPAERKRLQRQIATLLRANELRKLDPAERRVVLSELDPAERKAFFRELGSLRRANEIRVARQTARRHVGRCQRIVSRRRLRDRPVGRPPIAGYQRGTTRQYRAVRRARSPGREPDEPHDDALAALEVAA